MVLYKVLPLVQNYKPDIKKNVTIEIQYLRTYAYAKFKHFTLISNDDWFADKFAIFLLSTTAIFVQRPDNLLKKSCRKQKKMHLLQTEHLFILIETHNLNFLHQVFLYLIFFGKTLRFQSQSFLQLSPLNGTQHFLTIGYDFIETEIMMNFLPIIFSYNFY